MIFSIMIFSIMIFRIKPFSTMASITITKSIKSFNIDIQCNDI